MAPRTHVWVVPRGYTPQTGCEIKGKVVLIEQYGGGGSRPVQAPSLPSNMILTEAGHSLLQENGDYLLLEENN
jgi:hypothetical protein